MREKDSCQRFIFEHAPIRGEMVHVHNTYSMSEDELLNLDNETILYRLYHETELRLFQSKSVHFLCSCLPEKMLHVLQGLGETQCKQLLEERQGRIEMHCDFCNKKYTFDGIDIAVLFKR